MGVYLLQVESLKMKCYLRQDKPAVRCRVRDKKHVPSSVFSPNKFAILRELEETSEILKKDNQTRINHPYGLSQKASVMVVSDSQTRINEPGGHYKEDIPAVPALQGLSHQDKGRTV